MIAQDCVLLPLSLIRPTEQVSAHRVEEVVAMIRASQAWTRPICIEGTVGALLDGHHRLAAAQMLGLARVPVQVFDYNEVDLTSWRPGFAPTRAEVIGRALSGDLYPYKTTRHAFRAQTIRPIPVSILYDGGDEAPSSLETALRCGVTWRSDPIAPSVQDRRRG